MPETPMEFNSGGNAILTRLMPNQSQKLVTKYKLNLDATTFTFGSIVSATTCPNLHGKPIPAGMKLDYQVSGNILTMMQGQVRLTKATSAQVQKLTSLSEGCR